MVRRYRYQRGHLFKRGRRNQAWVARWRETVIEPNGTARSINRSEILALVRDVRTRREAQGILEKRLSDLNQGLRRMHPTISFGEFANTWEEAVLPTYRTSTRNFYQGVLNKHLRPYFANWRLCDIRTPEVQIFLNQKAKRYSPAVLYHIRATLSRVFVGACKWGYAEANPTQGVELPQKESVKEPISFQPDEVRRILARLKEPYKSMAIAAALTGVRASELFALSWCDIRFEKRQIHIRQSFYEGAFGPPKSKASKRAIPMGEVLAAVLEEHRSRSKPNEMDLVFANAKGKPYDPSNLVRRALRPVLRELGLPETGWRAFRRSVATALSELREPVRTAQMVLGHSSPQTTLAHYTQSPEESQRRAVAKLEQLLFPTVPKFRDEEGVAPKLIN